MNIFRLDNDPIVCARNHCDRHVVKMPLEYLDILKGLDHPLGRWAWECWENFDWLKLMAEEVCREFFYRYRQLHWCAKDLAILSAPQLLPFNGHCTEQPFINEGVEVITNSVIENYRDIYRGPKRHLCTWSHRLPPVWFSPERKEGFLGTDKLFEELTNVR